MNLIDICRWAVGALLTGVFAWAAISDIRDRKIPNWTVLAVIALFVPWTFLTHAPWLLALAAGGIALLVSFMLYAMGAFGAGDSKLFSAAALCAGLAHLAQMTVLTALAGGVIAAISLAARPHRAMVMLTMRGKGDYGKGVPYGVAIAIGAVVVIWSTLLGLPLPAGI
jgi:prepilin peptidase CpaA